MKQLSRPTSSGSRLTALEALLVLGIATALVVGWLVARELYASTQVAEPTPVAGTFPPRKPWQARRRERSDSHEPRVTEPWFGNQSSSNRDLFSGLAGASGFEEEEEDQSPALFSQGRSSPAEDEAEKAGSTPEQAYSSRRPQESSRGQRTQSSERVVLWRRRGLCGEESEADAERRRQYIAEFGQVSAGWEKGLFANANAPAEAIEQVRQVVPTLPARVGEHLGLHSQPPAVYVHKSQQAMRDFSCVNSAAVAYYDGNIHVSLSSGTRAREELTKSLEHEYVHHALLSNGLDRPIWFQEGAAMAFAKESWEGYRFVSQPIELNKMVDAFAHTAKPDAARAFYLQAYAMTRLLRDLWKETQKSSERDLAEALQSGRATPETLFSWALEQRMGITPERPLEILDDYIENGFKF